jgi:hypothetical protein
MFKLRLVIFNLVGFLFMTLPVWCCILAYYVFPDGNKSIGTSIILIVSILLTFFFRSLDSDLPKNGISVLNYFKYLKKLKRTKSVYHSILGRFLCISDDKFESINVYDLKIFYIRCLDSFYTNNRDTDYIAKSVKEIIDVEYKERLKKQKIEDRINNMKKWDGYLDTEGKRDDKINKILS